MTLQSCRDAAVAERDTEFAQGFNLQQRQAGHHGTMLHLSATHPSFRPAAQMASRSHFLIVTYNLPYWPYAFPQAASSAKE